MSKIEITINDRKFKAEEDLTILWAANTIGIRIPTLCHEIRLKPYGACRVCVVEVEGEERLTPSCAVKIRDGMVIQTESDRVKTRERQ